MWRAGRERDRPQAERRRRATDALIGQLEIPRLGLSVAVLRGNDERTLEIAAGHLPDTPPPWKDGNAALAGHRDTLFRPLARIRTGVRILLTTARGTFEYRVRHLRVVTPLDLSVLEPSGGVARP